MRHNSGLLGGHRLDHNNGASAGDVDERFELAGGAYAPTAARLAIDGLDDRLDSVLLSDVRLLVSEVVTNSVKHAGAGPDDSITMEVAIRPEVVRIEVSDFGEGFEPPTPNPDPDDDSGWGLFLVEQIADRWGVSSEGGTSVWFELARPQQQAA
jgi:anti-sigma regulatory factor (Ser/Thr protein kinase)